jgi:hypothetical protein
MTSLAEYQTHSFSKPLKVVGVYPSLRIALHLNGTLEPLTQRKVQLSSACTPMVESTTGHKRETDKTCITTTQESAPFVLENTGATITKHQGDMSETS